MKLKNFAPFTWGVLGWNLIVILWGAYVRASGSGAGCGRHWPLCDGQVVPQAPDVEMGIEFTHRLLSGGALLLVGAMVIWGFRITKKNHPVRKGLVAAGILILTEALLGAGLVLFELVEENSSIARAIAVALHLTNTFLLVGSLALTAYWASGGRPVQLKGQGLKAWLLGGGLLGMLLIGMSGAVTALGDTLFPVGSLAEGITADLDPNAHFLVRLRVYHPIIAVVIAIYSLYLVRMLFNQNTGMARKFLTALVVIGVAQLAVGLTNLLLLVPIPTQLLHLLTADLVWITYVLTTAVLLAKPETPTANSLEVV
ncbi:MAG: COX15/CtaA family protein [Anaerolineales bacterium]|jgi:heme A synthase